MQVNLPEISQSHLCLSDTVLHQSPRACRIVEHSTVLGTNGIAPWQPAGGNRYRRRHEPVMSSAQHNSACNFKAVQASFVFISPSSSQIGVTTILTRHKEVLPHSGKMLPTRTMGYGYATHSNCTSFATPRSISYHIDECKQRTLPS
eukprot:1976525-Pleurochrysis_carterae.AAC.1